MRRFSSYGPPNPNAHFCVARHELVERCIERLLGFPEEGGGHFFTIWAPRQTGKTWLMEQARQEIRDRHGDEFRVETASVEGMVIDEGEPAEAFLKRVPWWMEETFRIQLPEPPPDWESFERLFLKEFGLFERPVILAIDEFDKLPAPIIERLVSIFRNMYLRRRSYQLHGLALLGVRAVLGVESQRGSPFNVQRSLRVPNFTPDEVAELYRQYQDESGQAVEPGVVTEVHRVTRGQPGLVCWFGELLTDKENNPSLGKPIDHTTWKRVHRRALFREWNNTVLNLVKKAKGEYLSHVLQLFSRSDIAFKLDADWCNYLYMNGIIDAETTLDGKGSEVETCRFSSPFIQERLYSALADDLVGDRTPIPPVEILDDLADVFVSGALDVPALLERYKGYLVRLEAKGLDPWREQPRRSDLHLTEAAGHFHLYAWLQAAVGRRCVVSPEFPTGNGKVDLHLRYDGKQAIIEVKSFVDQHDLGNARQQAARYAASLGLESVTLALFVPSKDEHALERLSSEVSVDGVHVIVVAIGWEGA